MKIADEFMAEGITEVTTALWEEVSAELEDLFPFAREAAPIVIEGHEHNPLHQQLAVSMIAGIVIGWKMRELKGAA